MGVDYATKYVKRATLHAAAWARFARRSNPAWRQVLDHVVLGRMNKQIAQTLGTVEKTIKVHRGRIMAKLEVRSVAELVRLCERAGMACNAVAR